MTFPARVRLHYGHPDLFNKLFVMTKGGISKATRSLHLTEDVFCGCNHMLRGARIRKSRPHTKCSRLHVPTLYTWDYMASHAGPVLQSTSLDFFIRAAHKNLHHSLHHRQLVLI
eukprot:1159548-Pelagomonas_calceolata.AAC.12